MTAPTEAAAPEQADKQKQPNVPADSKPAGADSTKPAPADSAKPAPADNAKPAAVDGAKPKAHDDAKADADKAKQAAAHRRRTVVIGVGAVLLIIMCSPLSVYRSKPLQNRIDPCKREPL